ncbi:MAG: hypothetical protein MPW14_21145 [Candidatus Manganitrophus sp.]|nr:MAG: hypothetical protein MPW14_21145 [Candidatus Manganitrophus sp.]
MRSSLAARRDAQSLDLAAGQYLGDDGYLGRQPGQRLRYLPLRLVVGSAAAAPCRPAMATTLPSVRSTGFMPAFATSALSPATNVVVTLGDHRSAGARHRRGEGLGPHGFGRPVQFPGLANIPAGGTVDVYVEWTPNFAVTAEQIAAGTFAFHTCVRVKLDHVAGELVLGNQDGDREQENISYFQAVSPGAPGGATYKHVIKLRNDDLVNKKIFYLSYISTLPSDWKVDFNGGVQGVELLPNEMRELPITIEPGSSQPIGSVYGVDVSASSLRLLKNDLNPKDQHPEFKPLGGVRVEARVLAPVKVKCRAFRDPNGIIRVSGDFRHPRLRYGSLEILSPGATLAGLDRGGGRRPLSRSVKAGGDGCQGWIVSRCFAA